MPDILPLEFLYAKKSFPIVKTNNETLFLFPKRKNREALLVYKSKIHYLYSLKRPIWPSG